MSKRVEEIKSRLEKATPGPWNRDPYDSPRMQVIANGNEVIVYHGLHGRQNDKRVIPNMELIAHAPEDIRYLLKRLEEAERICVAAKPLIVPQTFYEFESTVGNLREVARSYFANHKEGR